jgi:hypothetical protein
VGTSPDRDTGWEVDQTFCEAVVENTHWLLDDSTRLEPETFNNPFLPPGAPPGTLDGYEFKSVTSGDIAHALGLQSGDHPLYLDVDTDGDGIQERYDLVTMQDVLDAWDLLGVTSHLWSWGCCAAPASSSWTGT